MALVDIKKGVYSAVSEAYGSEVAALEATANDANVESTSDRLTDWINEGGRLMARYGVALRGRRAKELTAREVVKLADLDLIQSPPGLAGTVDCGAPWAAYRVGYGPAGALAGGGGAAALTGAFSVVHSGAYAVAASGGGSPGIFTPFAFAAANVATVWGAVLAGPVFAGVTAGLFADFGVLSFNTNFSGLYTFAARACTSLTMVVSLAAPTTAGYTSASSVTVTAYNASGVQVGQVVQALTQADVGVNKTITLALGGQSVASVRVTAYLQATWSYPSSGANVAGFGVNFRQFQIVEVGGGGGAAMPSIWLTFCGLAERERWRSVVAPGSVLRYWHAQAEGVVSLWPSMTATQTIFADALHSPIPLVDDADNWGWLPVGAERLLICFGASRLCEVRRDDPRLGPLAPIFLAEFVAGVERLREDVPFDVRHLFDSITAARIPALGR